jgi:hypothetical protein
MGYQFAEHVAGGWKPVKEEDHGCIASAGFPIENVCVAYRECLICNDHYPSFLWVRIDHLSCAHHFAASGSSASTYHRDNQSAMFKPLRKTPKMTKPRPLKMLSKMLASGLFATAGLKQKPRAALRLINPVFKETRRGHVTLFIAEVMCLAHLRDKLLVVVSQLRKHICSGHELRIVIQDALETVNVAYRVQCGATNLADAFCDWVGDREELGGLLIQKKMIVAEVRARHMPMEIFSLEIQSKHVR